MLEFRTNKYVRASGTIENKGNNETALEGDDITLRANLPYFYSSDVYFTRSEWNDGAGYTMRTEELGVSAEIVPQYDHHSRASIPERTNERKRCVRGLQCPPWPQQPKRKKTARRQMEREPQTYSRQTLQTCPT